MAISEQQLQTWSHQGSVRGSSETYQAIKAVLEERGSPYTGRRFEVFLQGSYGNDTNIYAESDVDIVICLTEVFDSDIAGLNPADKLTHQASYSPAVYGFHEFKADVFHWLQWKYGKGVRFGKKAIFVPGNGNRRDADVVVCIKHYRYVSHKSGSNPQYDSGICFWKADKTKIVNFPKQHRDNLILDQQIRDTIRQYAQVRATVEHAERSGDLRRFIAQGKKIIISTIQKFPFILDEIGSQQRGRAFAIIIDEAHSSQGGKASAAMSRALGETTEAGEDDTGEDRINRLMASRKLLPNASYYAFTATPKNRTLEIFGDPEPQGDGTVRHRPFHVYSMKQAIQEGFILDVLQHYTPVNSYYRLAKIVADDPEFDANKARKKLRRYVEGHQHAIRHKAEIMVDHFHEQVIAQRKIDGKARAMVVTNGIERAIQYVHAIRAYLKERKSPYRAIVAFSGEHDHGGRAVNEAVLNGFPSANIADKIQEDPYRFLVCADKFQTGYDEPLLHTMYVDKALSGVKAVQTLSRLNRAHAKKHDVFVLDFQNDTETIKEAFSRYYRTTILSDETDPNKLHDLQSDLDNAQVYAPTDVETFVQRYLDGVERQQLDPIPDRCVAVYRSDLDEDGQVAFKSKAKAFVRTYAFLSSLLPYNNRDWEERSIFLNVLIPKLPAPVEEDLSRGILETIDMDSYRAEKKAMQAILLDDEDGEIDPAPGEESGGQREAELDLLSNIIASFNDLFGGIPWADQDRVLKMITVEIPAKVMEDPAFKNAKEHSDRDNARVEHTAALTRVMTDIMKDDTQFFKYFMDNPDFKQFVSNASFDVAYGDKGKTRPACLAKGSQLGSRCQSYSVY